MISRLRLLLVCIIFFPVKVSCHGRLVDPPARGTMWRLGFSTPPNYNDHELFCGGFARQWNQNKGRCGECGDPWDIPRPRPNESGGIFGTGKISKAYRKGEVITITVHLTANHLGWFEFRLCQNSEPMKPVKQSCLNKNVLKLVDHRRSRFHIKDKENIFFKIRTKLPDNVTCTNCVIQWHYTTGNNWGFCFKGENKAGCGPQEVFRGCSDVAIFEEDDDRYFKYQNLFDLDNYIEVNSGKGQYESDHSEENETVNNIDTADENAKYSKKRKANNNYYVYSTTFRDSGKTKSTTTFERTLKKLPTIGDQEESKEGNAVDKLSKVLALLITLGVSSSSSTNLLLDRLSNQLSRAIQNEDVYEYNTRENPDYIEERN